MGTNECRKVDEYMGDDICVCDKHKTIVVNVCPYCEKDDIE